MNDLTLVYAYYLNKGMLDEHYRHWRTLPQEIKNHLRAIVVDDGSPHNPAMPPTEPLGFPVSVFRILVDIPWNQDACRNLAMMHCDTQWALLTDMDHLVPVQTLEWVINAELDPACVYRFSRVSMPDLSPYKPHPNSFLMTRELYDRIGGYEERFGGYYGTDGHFLRAIQANASLVQTKAPLIRYPREVIHDASTTTLRRKNPNDKLKIDTIRRQISRMENPEDRRPKRNMHPWVRIN